MTNTFETTNPEITNVRRESHVSDIIKTRRAALIWLSAALRLPIHPTDLVRRVLLCLQ